MNYHVETTTVPTELISLLNEVVGYAMRYDTDILLRYVKMTELTLPLIAVLTVVERQGAITIGELGACLDYSLANASLLVDKLVCRGCVTRVENASDRRHKLVRLTPEGQALLAELRVARADNLAQQLRLLPANLVTQSLELLRSITDELPLGEVRRMNGTVSTAAE